MEERKEIRDRRVSGKRGSERKRGEEGGRYGTEESGKEITDRRERVRDGTRELRDRRKREGWHQDMFIS